MTIRIPAVAGTFYPENKKLLAATLKKMLLPTSGSDIKPRALIVPHAGYQYSGSMAAKAYSELLPWSDDIETVILVGPAHRYPLRGIAVPSHREFATPLGNLVVDKTLKERALEHPQVVQNDAAHRLEHSLEVQLPFLQMCLKKCRILPMVVGWTKATDVCSVIDSMPIDQHTLLLVSTDLSHFHHASEASQIDAASIRKILAKKIDLAPEEACGAHGLNGFLQYCQQHQWQPKLLGHCHSGDITGDQSRVVGYASFSVH